MKPLRSTAGVPHCDTEGCPQFDGKRCRLFGMRPGMFCEPALEREYEIAARLAGALNKMNAEARAHGQVRHVTAVEAEAALSDYAAATKEAKT